MSIERTRILEEPVALLRFKKLKSLGKRIFDWDRIKGGVISQERIYQAQNFLSIGAQETNPPVLAIYWEHVMTAVDLGKRIAQRVTEQGGEINPLEVEFLLWIHDIGRLALPVAFYRNDLVGNRLLTDIGVPRRVTANLPSLGKLLEAADKMNLTNKQITFEKALIPKQKKLAESYFVSLSSIQRIINLADNLGKGGTRGILDIPSFIEYFKVQEKRYVDQDTAWPSIHWATYKDRRKKGAVLQVYVIERTIQWLESMGVDFEEIRNGLLDHRPKFVVIARHGELHNPHNLVYNRDTVMKLADIIHISDEGKGQMKRLGQLIKERELLINNIETSPESRAKESSTELNYHFQVPIHINDGLDDVYAPGPYREHMTMDQLMKIGGNVYEGDQWEKYQHESPTDIIQRMRKVFWKTVQKINAGEAGILLSHGDPIAWFANTIFDTNMPDPKDLRNLIYPAKGEGYS